MQRPAVFDTGPKRNHRGEGNGVRPYSSGRTARRISVTRDGPDWVVQIDNARAEPGLDATDVDGYYLRRFAGQTTMRLRVSRIEGKSAYPESGAVFGSIESVEWSQTAANGERLEVRARARREFTRQESKEESWDGGGP